MVHVSADRVSDTTTTSGTGTLTLVNSAPTGFRTFGAVMATNDTCYYCIEHQSANEWEVGLGTYNSTGPTLARTTVLASSNSNATVTFSSGTKNVFITSPAKSLNKVPGEVFWYAGNTAPFGSLVADGSTVSRSTYAALYAAIGTIHGTGDGSTTFHLPKVSGRVIRGRDGGVALDPDRASRTAGATGGSAGDSVGSVQDDALQDFSGTISFAIDRRNLSGASGAFALTGSGSSLLAVGTGAAGATGLSFSASAAGARTSTETRMKNIYLLPCIAY